MEYFNVTRDIVIVVLMYWQGRMMSKQTPSEAKPQATRTKKILRYWPILAMGVLAASVWVPYFVRPKPLPLLKPIESIRDVPKTTPDKLETWPWVTVSLEGQGFCRGQNTREFRKYQFNSYACFSIKRDDSWKIILVWDHPLQFTAVNVEAAGKVIGTSLGHEPEWFRDSSPERRIVTLIYLPRAVTDNQKEIVIRPFQVQGTD